MQYQPQTCNTGDNTLHAQSSVDNVCDTLAKFRSTVIVIKVFILRLLLIDRGRTTKQISMFSGVRTQIQTTKMFSVFIEMSLSTAAASRLSTACSMHVVRQQRKLCR